MLSLEDFLYAYTEPSWPLFTHTKCYGESPVVSTSCGIPAVPSAEENWVRRKTWFGLIMFVPLFDLY